jgi:deoxycytidine triphosphate deaminase
MLSARDIKRELGKNIYIHPLCAKSIKANSIDLRVSKFAWSLSTKESIYRKGDGDNHPDVIVIPPRDTALISTKEVVYVSKRIAGSFHSKVTLVSQGAGHIGTCLDAGYIGPFLITLHNHSDHDLELKVDSEFVTLIFWYLNTPAFSFWPSSKRLEKDKIDPGHVKVLLGGKFDDDTVTKFREWRSDNEWVENSRKLRTIMKESKDYRQCKKWWYIGRGIVVFATFIIISIFAYFINLGKLSDFLKALFDNAILQVIASVLAAYIVARLSLSKIRTRKHHD